MSENKMKYAEGINDYLEDVGYKYSGVDGEENKKTILGFSQNQFIIGACILGAAGVGIYFLIKNKKK